MAGFKNLIADSVWKVARNLIRDYSELELLQTGSNNDRFLERSVFKAKENFHNELEFFRFASIQFSDSFELPTKDGVHILINPIDGIKNLAKGFPFFASTILQIKRQDGVNNVVASVMSFPALGQIFYAELGQGGWMEKYEDSGRAAGRRLRVSGTKDLAQSLTSKSFAEKYETQNSRDFGSSSYDIASYTSGKLDGILIKSDDVIHKLALELFAKESGGMVRTLENGDLVASNTYLLGK